MMPLDLAAAPTMHPPVTLEPVATGTPYGSN